MRWRETHGQLSFTLSDVLKPQDTNKVFKVFCAKPIEDRFLTATMWQNPFICNLLIILCFYSASKSLVSNKKPSDPVCLLIIIKYPELKDKHIQQLPM